MTKRKPQTRQVPVVQMTDDELTAAIAEWDSVRDKLDLAGTAAQVAQAALDALPVDASAEDRKAAEDALAVAKAAVADAEAAATALKPLPAEAAAAFLARRQNAGSTGENDEPGQHGGQPDGEQHWAPSVQGTDEGREGGGAADQEQGSGTLGLDGNTGPVAGALDRQDEGGRGDHVGGEVDHEVSEIPAGSQSASAAGQSGAVAPEQQDAQGPGGEIAKDALSETGAVASASEPNPIRNQEDAVVGTGVGDGATVRMPSEVVSDVVDREIDGVLAQVREMAVAGNVAGALAHIESERANAALMLSMAKRVEAALSAEALVLSRSATCWPLIVIHYDGAERPIGEALRIEPHVLEILVASGAVSETPPEDQD